MIWAETLKNHGFEEQVFEILLYINPVRRPDCLFHPIFDLPRCGKTGILNSKLLTSPQGISQHLAVGKLQNASRRDTSGKSRNPHVVVLQ